VREVLSARLDRAHGREHVGRLAAGQGRELGDQASELGLERLVRIVIE
jgi:hypothetical protein